MNTITFVTTAFCLILIEFITIVFFIICRRNKDRINKENKASLIRKIEILTKKNTKNEIFNELQSKVTLQYKAYLSSVIAPFKELLDQNDLSASLTKQIQVANKSSLGLQNILFLLENINKIHKDETTLNVSKYQNNVLGNVVINYFNQLLNSCNIKLFVFKDKEDNDIWIDLKKISFIIKVLISDSYVHIGYNGTIWVSIKHTIIDNKKFCTLTIVDDGIYNEEFKEYNSFEDSTKYYGDNKNEVQQGITLITEIVKQHKGGIKILCNSEGFKQYELYIPFGKEHLVGRNDVKFTNPTDMNIFPTNEYVTDEEVSKVKINKNDINTIDYGKINIKNRKKLLIIEDHKDIQLYLKIIFEKEFDIIMADNGKDGLDKAILIIPDIIICDVMMPIMNGFECCKQLKNNIKTCYIPIVLLTALVEEEDIVKGLELGVEDYIVKPFNPKILKTKINNIVNQRVRLRRAYTKSTSFINNANTDSQTPEKEDVMVDKIIDIIRENIKNPNFGVKMLSEKLNMSQPTLYRKIKQNTNLTTIELIVGERLKTSAKLLKDGDHNVQEVAEMVGYNDIGTFRKHFIDFYGVTPSSYSKKKTTV